MILRSRLRRSGRAAQQTARKPTTTVAARFLPLLFRLIGTLGWIHFVGQRTAHAVLTAQPIPHADHHATMFGKTEHGCHDFPRSRISHGPQPAIGQDFMEFRINGQSVDQAQLHAGEIGFRVFLVVSRRHGVLLVVVCGDLESRVMRGHERGPVLGDEVCIKSRVFHRPVVHPHHRLPAVHGQENAQYHPDALSRIQVAD